MPPPDDQILCRNKEKKFVVEILIRLSLWLPAVAAWLTYHTEERQDRTCSALLRRVAEETHPVDADRHPGVELSTLSVIFYMTLLTFFKFDQ